MFKIRSIVNCSTNLLLIAIVLSLNACGESEPEETAIQTPAVDPRFVSAQSLIDYFNSLPSLGNEAGPAFVEILYAETPFQEQFLNTLRIYNDLHYAEIAMHERFGTTLKEDGKGDLFQPSFRARGEEVSVEGMRATAVMTNGEDRASDPLHLVKIGNRWWISCYVFEYSMNDAEKAENVKLAQVHVAMAAAGRDVEPRIRAGEFKTAEEARIAYKSALIQYTIEHPEVMRRD